MLHPPPVLLSTPQQLADLVVTLVILVFLAVLQMVQLIRCWTSNWARVAFACEYNTMISEKKKKNKKSNVFPTRTDEPQL
jgi:hypothetical protein